MTTLNVYLTFDGDCREAMEFYRGIFGGEFSHISTFGEMPPQEGSASIPDDQKDRIMHCSLPINDHILLMASDTGGDWSYDIVKGTNIAISVNTEDLDNAKRIFNALAEGGEISMPFDKTFWESHFGTLTDKYGFNWMVDCAVKQE